MPAIHRGILKSYTPGTHRASVQIAGSLSVWLESIPVAANVPPSQVVVGRECGVLFFTEDNPADAVVICIHGVIPSPPFSRIQDADNDTYVDVESSADEDIVHIGAAGNERLHIRDTAAAHVNVLGDLGTSGKLLAGSDPAGIVGATTDYGHAIGQAPGNGTTMLVIALSASAATGRNGVQIAPSWNPTANSLTFRALTGNCQIGLTSGAAANVSGISGYGLQYTVTYYNLSATRTLSFTDCAAMIISPAMTLATSALTIPTLTGVRVAPTGSFDLPNLAMTTFRSFHANFAGGTSVTNVVGLEIDAITKGTNRYGIRCGDIAGGTVAYILELGPATPHMRLEGTGLYNPAINTATSPLLVLFGNNDNPLTKTLRRLQWKDGATIGAGDRVVVAV